MGKKGGGASYYAVAKGRRMGVFQTWTECEQQVSGVSGSIYKKFKTMEEAESYVAANRPVSVWGDEEPGDEAVNGSTSNVSGPAADDAREAVVAPTTPAVEDATTSPRHPANAAQEHSAAAPSTVPTTATDESPRVAPIFSAKSNGATTDGTTPDGRQPSRYYAVARGHEVGVYTSWAQSKKQTEGFPGARCERFKHFKDAQAYVDGMRVDIPVHDSRSVRARRSVPDSGSGIISSSVPGTDNRHTAHPSRDAGSLHISQPLVDDRVVGSDTAEEESEVPSQTSFPSSSETKRSLETSPQPSAAKSRSIKKAKTDTDPDALADAPIVISSDEDDEAEWIAAATAAATIASSSPTPSPSSSSLPKVITVYCDGAATQNGHNGARAGYGVWFAEEGDLSELNESKRVPGSVQSNNRAELWAAIRAIQLAPRDRPLIVYTDSKYTIQTVTSWIINWRKNKWRTASKGTDVRNRDLIRRLDKEIRDRPIKPVLKHIKGHAGHHGNEMADRLAVNGARLPAVPDGTFEDPEPPPSDDEMQRKKVEDPKRAFEVAVSAWERAGFTRETAERKAKRSMG